MTGNPVRQNILEAQGTPQEARRAFGLDAEKKTVLIVGGSLGARTMNRSVLEHLDLIKAHPEVQFIWQTANTISTAFRRRCGEKNCPTSR